MQADWGVRVSVSLGSGQGVGGGSEESMAATLL